MSAKRTICVAGKNNIACDVMDYMIHNYMHDSNFAACCNRTDMGIDGWQRSYRAHIKKYGLIEKDMEELYEIENLIFISAEFDRILNPKMFKDGKLYNIHFSLLPAYRGMYTSVMPILYGEEKAGVTLHEIDAGIDTGKIIAQSSFELSDDMTSRDLYLKCMEEGKILIIKNAAALLAGSYESYHQPVKGASYFSKKVLDYNNLVIDLNGTAYQIQNQLRAYSFQEYQLPRIMGREVTAWKITDCRSAQKAGVILWEDEGRARISTADYDILVDFL